jgi:hypothetical protein
MDRSPNHPARWLAGIAGVLALAAFPAAATAAGPLPPATPCPAVGTAPCYSTTAPPQISPSNETDTPPEGRILSAATGTWSGNPSLSYQWYDCATADASSCSPAAGAGAGSRTYTVGSSDVGSWLAFVITATQSGASGHWIYESKNPAAAAVPINRGAPAVSGSTQDGQNLTATSGNWAGTMPITGYTYQWDRCTAAGVSCAKISGASSSTYGLTDKDVGQTIEVGLEATNAQGTGGATTCPGGVTLCPVFSKVTSVITPANAATPTISGTPQVDDTLSEAHGSWLPSGSTLASQWESCDASGAGCSPIQGATAQTYKLTSADVGHTLVIQETASQNGALSPPAASAPTGVVRTAPSSGGANPAGGANPGGGTNPSGGQPAPAGGSPSPSVVNTAQLRGLLARALGVHGQAARIHALLKRGGYAFMFSAPSAGRLGISWYRVQHGHKILVAMVNVMLHKAGRAKIELVLTRKGRNLLRGAGRMTLAAQGGFAPAGHATTSASRAITLIR